MCAVPGDSRRGHHIPGSGVTGISDLVAGDFNSRLCEHSAHSLLLIHFSSTEESRFHVDSLIFKEVISITNVQKLYANDIKHKK